MLQDPNSLMGLLTQYARAVGWSITAAVGFAFGIGIALKVFDMLSTEIDEWEEPSNESFVICKLPHQYPKKSKTLKII